MVEHDDSPAHPARKVNEHCKTACSRACALASFCMCVCVCPSPPLSISFSFPLTTMVHALSPFLVLFFSLSLEPRPDIFNKRFVPRRNNAHIPIYCVYGAYMSALARDNARRRGECAFPRGAAVVAREKTSFSPGKPPQNSSYRDVRISL